MNARMFHYRSLVPALQSTINGPVLTVRVAHYHLQAFVA